MTTPLGRKYGVLPLRLARVKQPRGTICPVELKL